MRFFQLRGGILSRFRRRIKALSNDATWEELQPLAVQLYSERFEFLSTFPAGAGPRLYWPEDIIKTLVNEELVRWELSQAQNRCSDEVVEFILSHGKKLFAIAAVIESNRDWLLQAMEFFCNNAFRDNELSAEISDEPHCLVQDVLTKLDKNLWRRNLAIRMCEQQWMAIIPVLSTDKANYDFDARAILPFKIIGEGGLGGAFSIVYKIEIHRDHLKDPSGRFGPDRPRHFAVKQIVPPDIAEKERITRSWANEAQTLKKMNEAHRDHILLFVTAFTRPDVGSDRSRYLIFEWAEGGSLEKLFQEHPHPVLTGRLVQQAATQMLGLARALEATHELANIRHGDIKPENIFRFKPTAEDIIGTLKIGDWGQAKHHPDDTAKRLERGQQTDTRYGTVMYEPPEVELGEAKLLSRQYDVWSTGCVTLEILIWMVYGYESVQRFRSDVRGQYRESVPCYLIEESRDGKILTAKLQPIVEKWLEHIADDPVCANDTALGELLNLVRSRLLIVELPPDRQTVLVKNWEREHELEESLGRPSLVIRSPTVVGGHLVRSNELHRYRATSAELANALDEIMDDEDRPSDYWLRREAVGGPAPSFFQAHENPLTSHLRSLAIDRDIKAARLIPTNVVDVSSAPEPQFVRDKE